MEYNLFLVNTIEKVGYLILAKKEKITIFDDKDNIALVATRIKTSYLVNVLTSKKILVLAFSHLILQNNAL